MNTDLDLQSLRAAESILRLLLGEYTRENVLKALQLAYTTGYRDLQYDRVQELLRRDDHLNEVT